MRTSNKTIYNFFLIILLIIITISCVNIRNCSKNVIGRYFSEKNNLNITSYLDLKSDGTYYHYYKENGNELMSSGHWKKVEDPYCKIEFFNWENYNEDGLDFLKLNGYILYINGNFLDTTPDGNDIDSYKKK